MLDSELSCVSQPASFERPAEITNTIRHMSSSVFKTIDTKI